MALPHLVSVDKYLVFHNEAQRAAVHDRNVKTVYDLFSAVWFDSDRLPRDPSRMYVLKGRLLGFLNAACRKTFIDLHALRRDKLIEFGGKYPDHLSRSFSQRSALRLDHPSLCGRSCML